MFEVGQRIVCINDDFSESVRKIWVNLPKKDVVYTVRGVELGLNPYTKVEGEVTIHLKELTNPIFPAPGGKMGRELGFNCERFVPLEEQTETEYQKKSNNAGLVRTINLPKPKVRELVEV